MEENDLLMWREIEKNPLKAHLMIISGGGKRSLWDFVRSMSLQYKICLAVKPNTSQMEQRWKDIARCVLKDILAHTPSEEPKLLPSEPYISKGIYEAHVRRAYERKHNGKLVIVSASVVNALKLDAAMREALLDMVKGYNKHVVEVAKKDKVPVRDLPCIAGWKKPY